MPPSEAAQLRKRRAKIGRLETQFRRLPLSEKANRMKAHTLLAFLALAVLLLGCGSSTDDASSAVSAAARAEAAEIFETRCATCHGPVGKGDGPGSKGLTPPVRDLTEASWQKSVTDEHIEKITLYGGTGVQMSPQMPPNPDLNGKPEVVTAIRIHVRELKGK